ncbi:MAG: HAMP domain-containing protein [Lachnospiraceae bacterium]|nr:HAMP domain-containing protein [Candidatus Colinaster scatohippi]
MSEAKVKTKKVKSKANAKVKKKGQSKAKLNMYVTLVLYALIPLLVGVVVLTAVLLSRTEKQVSEVMTNYIFSMAKSQGAGLNNEVSFKKKELALSKSNLTEYCKDIKIEGIDSSYAYVADADGVMLWHPSDEKIGQPVTNEVIQEVCTKMSKGKSIKPEIVNYVFKGEQKIAAYYVAADNSFVLVITADRKEVVAETNKMLATSVAINVVLVIFFAVVALLIARIISTPLKKLSLATRKLADGELNVEIDASSHITETVQIIESANVLKNSLLNAVGAVKENVDTLEETVVAVDSKTASNTDSIDQISSAVSEVADTSQSVAQSAQEMATKAVELGENIDSLTENVEKLSTASEEISKANSEASAYMATVLDSSKESVAAVSNIYEKINGTNDSVTNISECVQMIEDISAQTNLLSLNASIEAARAGEAGRGFAVVADEIRKLADECAASAGQIREIVNQVIENSNETVAEAKKVADIIEGEQKYIADTQEKFVVLSASVDESIVEINKIRSMTIDLNEIKEQITGATSDLGAISEELGASAEEVAASCQTVTAACYDTRERTKEMRDIEVNLASAVEVFKM